MEPKHTSETRNGQRGAVLVEYALMAAVFALALVMVATRFQTIADNDLEPRGSLIGNPENLTPTN
ncbi:MAG: hypothetical protein OER95_11545 [Acidimicrobiia bacterium]|nr:hypothetical protein [Acidimicrobiia bacterium]